MAEVTISFDAWKEGLVAPTRHQVAVVALQSNRKLEAVSPRLTREYIHPNKTAGLARVLFSPDGKRIIAGDYPGGVVVAWDVATGKQLVAIETGYGFRGSSEYFFTSPDCLRLFVSREKRKYERVEQEGKRLFRWEFDGNVRAWDLGTGQLKKTFKHEPARNIVVMNLSPDGNRFVTFEELPGVADGPKGAASLWDTKSGKYRSLPDSISSGGMFSPDGQWLAISAEDKDRYTTAVKLFDSVTANEKLSIPVPDANTHAHIAAFAADGNPMVVNYRAFTHAKKWDKSRCWLKWFDTATGREIASFPGDKDDIFFHCRLSPDGQTLAACNWGNENRKLFLFRVADQRLLWASLLGKGERLIAGMPTFSPDARWIAITTSRSPERRGGGDPDPLDRPQARIHLVDAASGTIRETLVGPPGYLSSPCFSPDGKTLATSGYGRVLLWDMTN